jgi:aminopeptidase-like protein
MTDLGRQMYEFAELLWPLPRSITGRGTRETLALIKDRLPSLELVDVPSGTKVFDWTVPREWRVDEAYVVKPDGERILDVDDNNLHLVGYSTPVDEVMELGELQEHLHSIPEMPGAIPYVTSYYTERWGFCLSHDQRESLPEGRYRVVIRSELFDGHLTYGELILPGETSDEVFLSTDVCHPSLANNELSGPVVATFLSAWLASLTNRRYTYRVVFVPETIGSIAYLSRNLEAMRKNIVAGFNISCVGDDRSYSYLPSRQQESRADRVALHVLGHMHPEFRRYSYLDRGSDERQYCSPGVDLPVCSVSRTKIGEYPEYHTSLDNLELITPSGLFGAYEVLAQCIECLENDVRPRVTVLCEPQLGRRGLYPTLSTRESGLQARAMMDLLAYSDGSRSLLEIADRIGRPMWELFELVDQLAEHGLLRLER